MCFPPDQETLAQRRMIAVAGLLGKCSPRRERKSAYVQIDDCLRRDTDTGHLKNFSRGFVPPVAVETGGVSLPAERKRPSASWWR
jgi:hypothetical protein